MQPIPLIRVHALRPLLDFAKRTGVEVPSSVARAEAAFRDLGALVPLALGGQLWEEVARANGDDALGLRVAEQSRIEDIGELGWLIRRSSSVGEALETAVRFGSRFNTGQRHWLAYRGEEVWFRRHFAPALLRGRRQVNDFALTLTLRVIRLGAGAAWRPSEIHLDGPPPRHAAELAALAEKGVRFGESSTTLVFPRAVLDLPIPPAPVPSAIPRSSLPAPDFPQSVRQTIDSLLRLGSAKLPVAAEMSGMSARSLQRRLRESRLDFGHLVEEARFDSARRMLVDPGLKIVDVAAELGYSDSANFTRAFRRWTGVPPREFRRSQHAPV